MKVVLINPWLRKELFSEAEKKLSESSVLLINETDSFPFEFCYIASKLKKNFEVVVIDANALNMDLNRVMKEISEQNPDYVGIPTASYWSARCPVPFIPHVKEITLELKRRFPKIKVVVWGTHGTIFPEKILDYFIFYPLKAYYR